MENNAQYELVSLKRAIPRVNLLFGIKLNEADFIEIALTCLNLIGNTYGDMYLYIGKLDENGVMEVPCNVEYIEAVTVPVEVDWRARNLTNIPNSTILNYSLYKGIKQSEMYARGTFVHYRYYTNEQGKFITLVDNFESSIPEWNQRQTAEIKQKKDMNLAVLYKGVIVDEEGLPLVTERDIEAICYYINYIDVQKKVFMSNPAVNPNVLSFAEKIKNDKILQARVGAKLNQNTMNQIMDIRSSFDRKYYGRSYHYTI